MVNEQNEILFSQLADGELESDHANDVLLDVLDDPAGREQLKEMLRLRRSMAAWRGRQPSRPVMLADRTPARSRAGRGLWRLAGLAAAACVGGLLVLAGVWAAGGRGGAVRPTPDGKGPGVAAAVEVTPEQMRQIAKVFALHESVAGPLAWYAADDQSIRLASAKAEAEAGQTPIGVLLKVASSAPGSTGRTYVIVCRNDQTAMIELPSESGDGAGLRVYLTPRTVNGKVDVRYAIAVDGPPQEAPLAGLSGQRRLGLAEAPLGQLAFGDKLLNVEAAAWPVQQERN